MIYTSKLGFSFMMPPTWFVRSDGPDTLMCCPRREAARELDELSEAMMVRGFLFTTHDLKGSASRIMRKRVASSDGLTIGVGGRVARAFSWSDGASEVFTAFVGTTSNAGLEFEFSAQQTEATAERPSTNLVLNFAMGILDSISWTVL
jgi:hypothetical protein